MAKRDIRSLDVGMLRTFDALMRERSVSRAATRLFLSQPAVSASLNRLRTTFGDPLFTRTAHGVAPTPRALELADQVERLLADLSLLLDGERAFEPAASSRIFRIGGSDHASHLLLPQVMSRLAEAGSRIRIFWESPAFPTMTERLRKGDLDLAVMPRTTAPRDLESEPMYADRHVIVLRKGHPLMAGGLTLDAFCEVPQVFFGHGASALDDQIDAELERTGRRRLTQVAVTTFAQMAELLAHTDHAAVMPQRVARHYAAQLDTRPLPFELPNYQLYLCWNRRANDDTGVQWMKDALRQSLSGSLADLPQQALPDVPDEGLPLSDRPPPACDRPRP